MTFRAVLGERRFLLYWSARVVSQVGDSIQEIAMLWLVYEVTNDPGLLSIVALAAVLPQVLLSLPAGVLVDKWNRKHVMVVSEVVRAVVVLAIPLVGRGPYLVPVVVGVALVEGVFEAFFSPARQAIIPSLVDDEELDSANTLVNIGGRASQLFYAVGGVSVALFGSFLSFYVNSATFVVSSVLLVGVPASAGAVAGASEERAAGMRARAREAVADIKSGLRYLVDARVILAVLVFDLALSAVISPLSVVLPVYTSRVLEGGSVAFGFLLAVFIAGRIVAGGLVRAGESYIPAYRGRIVVVTIVLAGVVFAAIGVAPQLVEEVFAAVVASLILFGALFGVVQITGNTLLHKSIPDDKQGIIFSVLIAVGTATGPLAIAVIGQALELVAPQPVVLIQGAIVVAVGLWGVTTPVFGFRDADVADVGRSAAAVESSE